MNAVLYIIPYLMTGVLYIIPYLTFYSGSILCPTTFVFWHFLLPLPVTRKGEREDTEEVLGGEREREEEERERGGQRGE